MHAVVQVECAATIAPDVLAKRLIDATLPRLKATPKLALAFCPTEVDPAGFAVALRRGLPPEVQIVGGVAASVIDISGVHRDPSFGALALLGGDLDIRSAAAVGVHDSPYELGVNLTKQLVPGAQETMLLFYDSIRTSGESEQPPEINPSNPLLKGLTSSPEFFPIFGAGVLASLDFRPSPIIYQNELLRQGAVCTMLGNVNIDIEVMHGSTLLDGTYYKVTAVDGPVIYELDGRPVVELLDETFGSKGWRQEFPITSLTFGQNTGRRFGPYKEEDYVIRLLTAVTPDERGIGMFEADLEIGDEIQLMVRDIEKIMSSTMERTKAIFDRLEAAGRTPRFGLYIDCAGRGPQFSGVNEDEADIVAEAFRCRKVPLLGVHTGVEIAPFGNRNRGLDWTGVLAVLTE